MLAVADGGDDYYTEIATQSNDIAYLEFPLFRFSYIDYNFQYLYTVT